MAGLARANTEQRRDLIRSVRWTRSSSVLLGGFFLTLLMLGYVWWPLAEEYLALIDWKGSWWRQLDWLLLAIFAFMTVMLAAGANLRADAGILLVGLAGGLVIESWGTQTELWTYYTNERPPLWIIPAWPIASLTIDRTVRLAKAVVPALPSQFLTVAYWTVFPTFFLLLLDFAWHTLDEPFTWLALILCALLIATPTDKRMALFSFAAGTGLGYFLELWGTTRLCWTYYTLETPPLFAVLAHGMAAVAFWRTLLLLQSYLPRLPAVVSPAAIFSRAGMPDHP